MASIKELYGSEEQLYDAIIKKVNFNLRCCIPGIVQSYNSTTNTAEIQPAVREEIVNEDNSVSYVNLPLLVNVPIVFPRCKNGGMAFPLQQNDECLIFFSDLSYDNFWKSGDVQNPIEVRRHDLSDGLAIPTIISQKNTPRTANELMLDFGNSKIELTGSNIVFSVGNQSITLTEIIAFRNEYNTHYHYDADARPTGKPV